MLHLKNISKKFQQHQVLDNLSLTVLPGDFVIIMGPNGTGKSTLFDIIAGKTKPDQGHVLMNQSDITNLSEQKRTSFVGRLFQNTYLGSCSNLTVRENIALASLKNRHAGFRKAIQAFPNKILDFLKPLNLDLMSFLDRPMGALSGGQRQIISFIMSILEPPKVLLLDEPTAALDPHTSTQLLTFARDYAIHHQIPTILITHDPLIAKYLGNRLCVLENGRIKREFGIEKNQMDAQSFFHQIDYDALSFT